MNKGTNITQTFTIRENGVIVDLNKDATAIKNQVIRGGVQLGKWDNELNTQNPQGDASLEGAEFAIINENAHDVIVNGKTYKKGQVVATLKTDANGNAQTASNLLPYGTYTLKETKAPTGYLNKGTNITQTFTIRENGVIVDLNKDATAIKNQVIRGGVQLGKWDNESNTQKAQGAATLAGAEFEITNQSSHDVIVNGKTYKKGQVVATLVTDENGIAKSAKDLLPYGKYSYEETKEPKGYLPTGSGLTGTFEIKENGVIVDLNKKDTAIKNNVIRGDITFTKSDAETSERMANIPFKITSNTTGESHVIYTDENGYYSSESKYVKHSENTNAETAKCGTWFGLDINGDQVPVKDSVGAFPYDTYTIQEVRCEANEGKALFKGTFTISMHAFTIDYGTITNSDVSLQTTAKNAATNTHKAFASEDVTIVDTVFYTGLKKNQTYTIKGIIMDKDTNEPLLDVDGNQITAETTFKAPTKDGITDVIYTFNGTGMEGKDVVVFEECYDKEGTLIVDHKNIEDKGQTIYFEKNPEIKTSAKDSETKDHISTAKENVSIIDTVSYKNLTVGNKYTISGTLMDKATGKAMKDSDGNKITAETSFTAKTADGSVEVVFTFDASDYEGKTTVVFEDLYYNGKLYVSHADLTDEGQTIYFPEIHTRAKDKESQLQETYANPDEKVTIEDTVAYKNLIQGKEYTVKGVLMDKETDEKLLDAEGNEITSETTFTAENEEGQVNVEFTFDASTLAGKATVVFEDLYYNKNFVATHADITDEGQTVYFPEIKTTAKDAASDSHNALPSKETTIIDTVKYTNLLVGKTYTVKGTLMDKDTKEPLLDAEGNQITGETSFTAQETSGEVEISFTFDSSLLEGTTVVVFEDAYENGHKVATHTEITDEDQSVHFPEIKTTAKDADTQGPLSQAKEKVTIEDTVSYKNLVKGKEYTVKGTLMNKETGEKLLDAKGNEITAETSFKAEATEGEVIVSFTFDASTLAGQTTVVFEDLYDNERLVATHSDLSDEGQTVHFPEIKTTAKDAASNSQNALPSKETTIVDTVKYSNLVVGKTYTVKGVLMDKDTKEPLLDGLLNQITGETTFTAEEVSGEVEVKFTFDSSALKGKTVVVFEDLYESDHKVATHSNITDKDQSVHFPEIKTTAKDAASDSHNALPSKETTIIDTVKYTNLLVGKTYTVKGTLMDKDTKEPLLDAEGNQITGETSFTAQETSGEVEISFTFDSSLLEGTTVVVFEDAYENGHKVATHTEITDEDQSVHFPEIKTTAKDADTQGPLSQAKEKVTIEDTVSYKNLVKGKEYTVKGTLMNKETGEKLLDAKGNEITAETSFKAEATEGEVIVSFTFDASTLAGQTTVVFEDLYDNERLVATHSDLSDEGQTVHFPEIKTTAKDAASNSQNALPSKETTIVDTVKYSNLVVGKTYTVKGVLMDKDTKEPLLDGLLNQITGETTFTAEEVSGEVEVKFTFDSSALKGKTVVVFEDLYESDHKVATHSNITDKDQSVHFPEIKTTATDKEDGDHTLTCGQVTIIDTIKYENLVPGYEYKVSGVLMDKSSGEKVLVGNKEVTAETSFTPEKANGTVEVSFSFDASNLGGRSLVVFEKVYDANGKEIANHEDINDEDQTVTVSEKGKIVTNSPGGTKAGASTVKTGDVAKTIPYLVMMVLAIVAATVVVIRKRKMNADEK